MQSARVAPRHRPPAGIAGGFRRRVETLAKERVERDEEDLVRLYLTDIGQYPLLTKDDEVRLAQTIEGGRAAEGELATKVEGPHAGQAQGTEAQDPDRRAGPADVRPVEPPPRGVDRQEVSGVGAPAARPDPRRQPGLDARRREVRLAQGLQILRPMPRGGSVRPSPAASPIQGGRSVSPCTPATRCARVQKAQARLELKLGRPATLAELGDEVEMPEDKLIEALRFRAEPLSSVGAAPRGRGRRARRRRRGPLGRVALRGGGDVVVARGDQPSSVASRRTRARDPPPAVRPRPRRAAHAGGSRGALQPDPGTHTPDRGAGHVQAASPVVGHRAHATCSRSEPVGAVGPRPPRSGGPGQGVTARG